MKTTDQSSHFKMRAIFPFGVGFCWMMIVGIFVGIRPFWHLFLLAALAGIALQGVVAVLWRCDRKKWPGRLLMWIDPPQIPREKKKVVFLVNDDETFIIQRLVMAQGVQNAGYDVHVATADLGFSQKVRELGFTFHELDLNRGGLNPLADFRPFVRLIFFLAKERPDILHCVSIKPVIYGATAGSIVGLRSIVCLVNGLGYAFEAKSLKSKLVNQVAKALYRNALGCSGVRVIFQNPDDRAFFIEQELVHAEKTTLIRGSGVNMQKFQPTPQPQNEKPVVLFVGRLLRSKGIQDLLDAAKTLNEENIPFTLKIVGSPDERNPDAVSKSYMDQFQHQEYVEWLGRQSDMPRFYKEADVVVLPQQNREGLPLTLLEAGSTGRALITTDVPGCREVVRNNINGFLIAPKDTKELTKALRTLLLNHDLRAQFGEKASEIVKKEFSSESVQKQLLEVYESLLNNATQKPFVTVTSV